jgi:hypothetical protein
MGLGSASGIRKKLIPEPKPGIKKAPDPGPDPQNPGFRKKIKTKREK